MTVMVLLGQLRRRRRERAFRRFHSSCDMLGVPDAVRTRALKGYTFDGGLPRAIDWYAGRPGLTR